MNLHVVMGVLVVSLKNRVKSLEQLVKIQHSVTNPIIWRDEIGDPENYDPEIFWLTALTTGRVVNVDGKIFDGPLLRSKHWGQL